MDHPNSIEKTKATLKFHSSLEDVTKTEWNSLTNGNPFVSYSFLRNLESHNCLRPQGWEPRHVTLRNSQGQLLGAMPLYLRSNSYGEFVFDWAWADAYQRAGGQYYPKLVTASPFSPVSGPRLLANASKEETNIAKKTLISATTNLCIENNISSWHSLFPAESEIELFESSGLLIRIGCQYHWYNEGFNSFENFLSTLKSKRRKEIRRERAAAKENGLCYEIAVGKDISEEQWQSFFGFYCSTFYKKWGEPRLNLDFFTALSGTSDAKPVLFLAKKEKKYVAGAFAILGEDTLYGRHWGCAEHYSMLHFELCYYRTIEFCIDNRLECLDAGAQGEHKLKRGFAPTKTYSAHWITDKNFKGAIANFLDEETRAVDAYITSKSS